MLLYASNIGYQPFRDRYCTRFQVAKVTPDNPLNECIFVNATNILIKLCRKGDLKSLKYLIDMGVNLTDVDSHGRNSVVYACYNGNLDVMRLLLENGADVNTCCSSIIPASHGSFEYDDGLPFCYENEVDNDYPK